MQVYSRLTDRELIDVYSLLPQAIAIYATDEIIIQHASDPMIAFWGKDRSIIGKPLEKAVPELKGQPFIGMLRNVLKTGVTEVGVAVPAKLIVDGKLQTFYYDYEYRAIKNEAGETYCILHTASDVTQLVLHKAALEETKDSELQLAREQLLNEELATANEELNAMNDELQLAQTNLVELNSELEKRVKHRTEALAKSESRARFLLSDAPVSISVFTGPEHRIESANTMILDAWGKGRQIIGMPVHEALPELKGQGFFEVLDEVYNSGRPFYGNEVKTSLEHNGVTEEIYSNFVYHPLKDKDGNTTGIMLVAIIVTEQVKARHKLDEFLSIASHELKTPLTSIKAFNQLMLKTTDNKRLDEFLKKTTDNIYSLEKLINDLLDVTKINAGKMNYNMEPFSFRELLEDSIDNMQHTTDNHQIILEKVVDVTYTGDQFRLAQVMQNLLSNAIKYSPNGNKVIVNSVIEHGNIVVSVQDFGIGIPADKLDLLFDRYYRVDNSNMRFEGLGLGLFISSEILKRHQGSFWIESKQNRGSTFYFRLPVAKDCEFSPSAQSDNFYQNSTITISYNKARKRIDVDWTGFQDAASVKNGCLNILGFINRNKCDRILNDNTNVLGTWSEASEWVGEVFFPMMEQAGVKYLAWVFSASVFSQLSAKKSLNVAPANIQTEIFTDIHLAEEWLNSKP